MLGVTRHQELYHVLVVNLCLSMVTGRVEEVVVDQRSLCMLSRSMHANSGLL